ncbi:hypothetical protein [Dactylosporangium sp. CA-139066]|uniref:hypothetical protein n=1 Tax=Dactylosporangium sp. CA-139066 TaxID=3239930 RepID=UPI003D909F66
MLLDADPAFVLPARLLSIPDWADPVLLAPVELAGGPGSLPPQAVRHLLTMLAMSRMQAAVKRAVGLLAEVAHRGLRHLLTMLAMSRMQAAVKRAVGLLAEVAHRGLRHLPPGFGDRLRAVGDELLKVRLRRGAERWVDAYLAADRHRRTRLRDEPEAADPECRLAVCQGSAIPPTRGCRWVCRGGFVTRLIRRTRQTEPQGVEHGRLVRASPRAHRVLHA